MLDVIVSTVDDTRAPTGLEYLGEPFRLLVETRRGWANATNALLDQTRGDVLQIDDDVELLPGALDLVRRHYEQADIFGIGLIAPNGPGGYYTQSAGHQFLAVENGYTLASLDGTLALSVPCLVAHAGASCLYIKRRVIDAGIRFMAAWDGVHHEDIPFCLSAWLAGFTVCHLPVGAIHYTHPIGAGHTRSSKADFQSGRIKNAQHLADWMHEHAIGQALNDGRIPVGVWGLDRQPFTLRPPAHLEGMVA